MPRITQDSIRRVREQSDIVDVIGKAVQLQRAGVTYKALCPFHKENTASFTVNPSRQTFKCFGCGQGGSVIDFVMEYEKLTFAEAITRLAERAGFDLEYESGGAPVDPAAMRRNKDRKALLFDVMTWAQERFHKTLMKAPEASAAREYLKSRGLPKDEVVKWGIGYAPAGFDITLKAGLSEFGDARLLDEVGITRTNERGHRYDFFRDRITFPIRDVSGRTVAFGARKMNPEDPGGKYINSPATPIYDKARVLYGIDRLPGCEFNRGRARGTRLVTVVEGYMDVIACHRAGIDCAVAPCGTSITPDQLHMLRRFGDRIVMIMDGDAAGQNSMERVIPEIVAQGFASKQQVREAGGDRSREVFGMNVTAVSLPDGKDPDDFLNSAGPEALVAMLDQGRDLFTLKLASLAARHDLRHPAGMKDAIEEALGVIAHASSDSPEHELLRNLLLRRTSEYFNVDEATLRRGLGDARRRQPRNFDEGEQRAPQMSSRVSPAERTLLLRLLTHPELIRPVAEFMVAEEFTSPLAGEAFRAVVNCFDESGSVIGANLLDSVPEDHSAVRKMLAELDSEAASLRENTDKSEFDVNHKVAEILRWHEERMLKRSIAAGDIDNDDPDTMLRKMREMKAKKRAQ